MNDHHDLANRVKTLAFTLAIVVSPFLALLISVTFAVFVLSLALLVTIWLLITAAKQVPPAEARRLQIAAAVLGVLLIVVVGVTLVSSLN